MANRFTRAWLQEAGLEFEVTEANAERQGFALAASLVANCALLDAETINVMTLKVLNGEGPEEYKRGYLYAIGVLSEAWRNDAQI